MCAFAVGRKKIKIERISAHKNRQVTFNKRRAGLMKKAMELSILCDCDIAMIILSGDNLYQYSSGNMEQLMKKYHAYEGQFEALTNKDLHNIKPGKVSAVRMSTKKRKKGELALPSGGTNKRLAVEEGSEEEGEDGSDEDNEDEEEQQAEHSNAHATAAARYAQSSHTSAHSNAASASGVQNAANTGSSIPSLNSIPFIPPTTPINHLSALNSNSTNAAAMAAAVHGNMNAPAYPLKSEFASTPMGRFMPSNNICKPTSHRRLHCCSAALRTVFASCCSL